jgi:hypothetical protein
VPRAIFRESALEAYRRRSERDVVPRLASTPIIACAWLLVATLLAAALIAWSVRVPAYLGATGVLLGRDATAAVVFAPPERAAEIRAGQSVRVRIGSSANPVAGVVARVQPGLIGPDEARRRYGLAGVITEPSTGVLIRLRRSLSPRTYAGSRVTARVEAGSQRLGALIPGLGWLLGGGSD